MLKKLTLAAVLALSPLAQAEVVADPAQTEPEITITYDGENTYYEYTINGQLKEIKVVPKMGEPYYLVPAEGSQKFIRVEESQLLIPKWVIFRW
ncbi:DUF2782 domain-containing protein [Marinobacterium sediminicola]|uniref:DUF2782 domain-containing protein n=1 Tax=Marinobacterium sediminicola TaxID=518898 RepID=A0ABY1S3M7_9GAMM|nr:DUF2782 domain-containing protein [Marinobacterium sediminicola]ULG69308.1 DUF2782 domain-containing protein [Marinobacterium sediminicola]SMR77659.1 Protein of unknown function [Marinobacterium sediminicola]